MRYRSRLLPSILAIVISCLIASSASAAELQLAGIKLGRSALTIIQKFGNPTDVRVGAAGRVEAGPQAAGMGEVPGMGLPGMGMTPDSNPFGPAAQPSISGPAPRKAGPPEVTWVYRFPKNRTLEFIINPDGRIMQIAAFGVEWPNIRTSKGITLGQTYKDVVTRYGYPESHQQQGIQLVARYPEKQRAIFTCVGKTVVGITIALMD